MCGLVRQTGGNLSPCVGLTGEFCAADFLTAAAGVVLERAFSEHQLLFQRSAFVPTVTVRFPRPPPPSSPLRKGGPLEGSDFETAVHVGSSGQSITDILTLEKLTKFIMAASKFDVDDGLRKFTDAKLSILPPLIESETNEHEDVVADPAPAPDLTGLADLPLVLRNFQEGERLIFGVPTNEIDYNRWQEIIPELNAEDYMDSESDKEYLQDDEDDEENENEEDLSMESLAFPPPANEASRDSSDHVVHSERRSEKPFTKPLKFVTDPSETFAQITYWESGLPDDIENVNAKVPVRAERSVTSTVKASVMGDPNATSAIEEGYVQEMIMYLCPSCSENSGLTLAVSLTPTTMLPGTSDAFVICKSNLELPTSGANGRIS